MKKKDFSRFIAVVLAICLVASQANLGPVRVSAAEGTGTGTTYYVDATGGSDANSGTSAQSAFQTIARANAVDLEPGDTILLKSGEVWHGEELTLDESGEPGNIITVSSYGEGSKPLIAADGISHGVFINNAEYILVKDIEITNNIPDGEEAPAPSHDIHDRDGGKNGRSGLEIFNNTGLIMHNIHVVGVDVHDMEANIGPSNRYFQGAIFFMGEKSTTSSFDDILIEGCHLWDNNSMGITSDGASEARPYTNVVIRNNVTERGGNGDIVPGGCYKPIIEHNASYDHGLGHSGYQWSVAIWEYACEDALFQYNESARSHHDPTMPDGQADSEGFDADIATLGRVTFQYNYSHDNSGGFMLVMPNDNEQFEGSTIRYNVSFNDGRNSLGDNMIEIHHSGSVGSYFYNNIIYDALGQGIVWAPVSSGTGKIDIQNNIFYSNGDLSDYRDGNDKLVFNNNVYYGSDIYPVEDTNAILEDPKFVGPIPEVALDGMESCKVFKLQADSPCINAGVAIDDNGGRDFFSNALYAGLPDIGIYEYGSTKLPETVYGYDPITTIDKDPLTHSGIYSVKATDAGSNSFSCTANVANATNYVAGIYNRGTGSYVIKVKNAANNAVLASKTFTASGQYAPREVSFNSGNATSVIFEVSGVGATGTAYFDDAFLGVSGGTNLLSDPNFEEEQSTWTYGTGFSHYKGSNIVVCVETTVTEPTPSATPTPPPVKPTSDTQINDEFDGTLGSQWHWINEVPENWEMTASSLHIDGLSGDVNGNGSNVLLQYAPEGDFTLETKMTGLPSTGWEQEGILLFVDKDNFIKLDRVNDGGSATNTMFQFGYAYDGTWPVKNTTPADPTFSNGTATDTCYLKLEKVGASYTGYYSFDGTTWTEIDTFDNIFLKSKGDKQIGLYSVNGTGIHTDFDYFHISDMDLNAEEPDQVPVELVLDPHTGNRALSLTGETSWGSAGYSTIQAVTGSALTASFWLKGSGNVSLVVQDSGWSTLAQQTFSATPEWTLCQFDVDGAGVTGELHVQFNDQQNADANILIDDVSLAGVDGVNLIPNPGFENAIDTTVFAWGYDGDGSNPADGVPDGHFWLFEVPMPHSGMKALTITGATDNQSPGLNGVDVPENTDLTAGFWLKGSGKVKLVMASEDWGSYPVDNEFTATDGWTYYSCSFNSREGGDDGISTLHPMINADSNANANMLIDDMFIGVEGGSNLISNPGFEDGAIFAWGYGAPFGLLDVTPVSPVSIVHSGSHSLKVSLSDGGSAWDSIGTTINSIPAQTALVYKAWVRGTGSIKLSSSSDWSTYYEDTFTLTDEWQEVTVNIPATDNTSISLLVCVTESGVAYVDDMFLGTEGGTNLLTADGTGCFGFEDDYLSFWSLANAFSIVEIIDPLAPPTLYDIYDKMYLVGDEVLFSIKAVDKNNDPCTYSAVSIPEGATFNPMNRVFKWTPSEAGDYTVTLGTSDGNSTTLKNTTIHVVEAQTEPQVTYNVTVASGITNGTVSLDKATAAAGETVTIATTPAIGYQLKAGSIKVDGEAITGSSFTMPAKNVAVTAEFELITQIIVPPSVTPTETPTVTPTSTITPTPTVTSTPTVAPKETKTVVEASELKEAIASGEDYTVSVKDDDGKLKYSWTFTEQNLKGADTNSLTDIKLDLEVQKLVDDKDIMDVISTKDNTQTGLVISFDQEGVLPVPATVKIYVGNLGIDKNTTVYLYHYNATTKKLEVLPHSFKGYKVDKDGYITINIAHCSEYVALKNRADASIITSLDKQISFAPAKITLYTGGSKYSKSTVEVTLPSTLELVNSLKDSTGTPAIGGVVVTYKSSNTKVVTVSSTGVITAKSEGTAKITTTVKLYYGKTVTYTTSVTVKAPNVKITKSVASMKVGDTFTFVATVAGYDKNDIVWKSTVKNVVVIDKTTGKAVAKSKGTDYVEAIVGGKVVKVKVVVK